ncbi:MAG: FprA family A-type flavoprotein [Prevotella sp.]
MIEIKNSVYYVGVNDRNKALFEGLWPLPDGVSYNSYLIVDEKVCLIDTVDVAFFPQFLDNIRAVIGDRPIDYIVINHMEPDHSGSLGLMRKYYPNVEIVGNKKSFQLLKGFYGISDKELEVKNGDELNLGSHNLKFFLTPMVHWPETMMTLDTTDNILFSGDGFGCFGALNGGVIDEEINCDEFWLEMVRYYSNIVGKYGIPVQNALKKFVNEQVDYICPTHGPVWHQYKEKVMEEYDRMSRYDTEEGIVICYGTMYGHTESMAECIAKAASLAGIKNIKVYNVSKTHHSYILRDVFRYRGLIVGAPTYNTGLYHEMEVLLSEIANRDIKNHAIGWFGNHGWASKAVGKIAEWNENHLKFEPVGEPVDMLQSLDEDSTERCKALGRAMAEYLIAQRG